MSEVHHRSLDILEDWTVRWIAGPGVPQAHAARIASGLSAGVPGVVHQDLIREGLLRHPDDGDGESEQAWVGNSDWTWTRNLDADDLPHGSGKGDVLELVFDSIDTVGTVRIGERTLGEVENQFHPHRFRLRAEDFSAGSVIEVALRSPMEELERRVARYGDRPVNADGEWGVYSYLRKAACSFGWDWGPKCPSLGLPGVVRIETWRDSRIDAIRPLIVACDERLAVVDVAVDLRLDEDTAGDGRLQVEVILEAPDGRRFTSRSDVDPTGEQGQAHARMEISDPERWWPRGRGPQPLHRLRIRVLRGDTVLDACQRRIGLRSTTLDTEPDAEGTPFRIMVNGEAIFSVGANWIPDGLFPGTAPDDRTRQRIEQAVDAGFNMLRVWGGGVYESDAFYEACDELGLMVWQDFMFACATYPEEDPYPSLIEAEARHQVSRLSSHASIVLWCGGNENVLAWRNWGWREKMDPAQSWGRRYFTELLPGVCGELDPSRPFLPDSPWSGSVEHDPNDPDHGDRHTWDFKVEEFREHVPRFVSEFGHQAPPGRRSIESAIGAKSFATESVSAMDAFASRQRGWGGDAEQYDRWLDDWFTPATNLDGRLWRMQLLQARATGMAFEWARFNQPRCAGALIWQLNDAWTGHSWSLIDVHGRPKPSWWAARATCRPRTCAFLAGEAGIEVGLANGTRDSWLAKATVRRLTMAGSELAVHSMDVDVAANAIARIPVPSELVVPEEPASEFLFVEVDGVRGFWFYGKDAWLSMPAPSLDVEFESTAQGMQLRLRSQSLIRDLYLDVARLSPSMRISSNLLTLLPGDERIIDLEGVENASAEELRRKLLEPGGIATANDCAACERPHNPMS